MIRAMLARGFFYWLRVPRNSADARHDEWILAFARFLLSASCLAVAIHARRSEPVALYEALSASYFAYSLLVILGLRICHYTHPLLHVGIHYADILWAVNLIIMINWPAMAFALFLFILFGTAFRWGFWETQLTTFSFCLLLMAGCSASNINVFQLWHYQRHLDLFPEALIYLALTLTVGFLAEAKAIRTEIYAIGKIIESVRLQSGLKQALRTVCTEGFRLFSATQILVAIDEKRVGKSFLFRLTSAHPVLETRELDSSGRAQYFFEAPAASWRMANSRQSGQRRFRCLTLEAGKLKRSTTDCSMPDPFLMAHPFRILLAISLLLEEQCAVRAFVVDPVPYFGGAAGLRFLDYSVRRVIPVIHDIFAVDRLKTRAEATVSSQVARELHDGVIQSLSSINLQLEELRRRAVLISGQGVDSLAPIQQSIQNELASLREFTQRLRSLDVDSSRLLRFLTGLAMKFQCEHGISAQFISEVDEVRLRPRVCAELAHIVQEGLINVRKHSNAKEVLVKFSRQDGKGVLDIIDNGRGFGFTGRCSHEELQASGKGPLVIMERARAIHGEVFVESDQGRGSWVKVTFPYEANC